VAAVPVPPAHRLPREYFEEFCSGGGGPAAVRELWTSELSRRMLLLRAVSAAAGAPNESLPAPGRDHAPGGEIRHASAAPPIRPRTGSPRYAHQLGPLPPAATAWSALTAAEAAAREPVRELLLRPQIGNWAAYTLRRHRGRVAASATPLWLDLGVIHTVALLASAEAGLSWNTRLPVRSGRLMLPGLGMVKLPAVGPADYADAETLDGEIRLRHHGSTFNIPVPGGLESVHWQGLRTLRVEGPTSLAITFDDLDPFRNLAEPVRPNRRSDAEFAAWQKLLDEAWGLLCQEHPPTAAAMAEGLVCIVPLADDGWGIRSASTGEAFGSVLISQPPDAISLALSLVHEFQHTKLGGLMHLGAMCRPADEGVQDRYYAPWRDDPRPLAGLIQGLYAYVGITGFWQRRRKRAHGDDRRTADFEYAYARFQVGQAMTEALRSGRLTPWGEALLDRLSAAIGPWSPGAEEQEAVEAATLLADFHRAAWAARHTPEPAHIRVVELTDAYLTGQSPRVHASLPVPGLVADDDLGTETVEWSGGREQWSRGFSTLIRRQLVMPGADIPERLRAHGIGIADRQLVRRDLAGARAAYVARIAESPENIDAWVGLGLADPSCATLLSRPQLVRAVYRRLAELGACPEPAALAAWLSPRTGSRN
jgi:HEXXH motif-containing protein